MRKGRRAPVVMGRGANELVFSDPATISLPAGVVPGELILIAFVGGAGGSGFSSTYTHTGYTRVVGVYAGGSNAVVLILARTATGSDAVTVTTSYGGGIGWWSSLSWRIAGGIPASVTATYDDTSDLSLNCLPPPITVSKAFLALAIGQLIDGGTPGLVSSYPAGYTNGRSIVTNPSSNSRPCAAEKTCPAGTETPGAIVLSSGNWLTSLEVAVARP